MTNLFFQIVMQLWWFGAFGFVFGKIAGLGFTWLRHNRDVAFCTALLTVGFPAIAWMQVQDFGAAWLYTAVPIFLLAFIPSTVHYRRVRSAGASAS